MSKQQSRLRCSKPQTGTKQCLWRAEGADLVITDLHMPYKNGLEIIKELRAMSPSTPVVAITDGGQTQQTGLLGDAKPGGCPHCTAREIRARPEAHWVLARVGLRLCSSP